MTCEEFELRLTDCLEGALAPEHYDEVETHCRTCEDCQSLTAMVAQIIDTCHALPKLDSPADLVAKILQRTAHNHPHRLSFKNHLSAMFRPVIWPKVAIGTALMLGFLSLSINFISSRRAHVPEYWLKRANSFAHQVYIQGLRLYDKKNEWQAQLKFLGASLRNKMEYHLGEASEELRQATPPKKQEREQPPESRKDGEKR